MYATRADLETRFGTDELIQLTDRLGGSVVVDAVVTRALADAQAEIDGYLSVRYPVPLTPVPDLIARLACDIARYYLHDQRAPEQVQKRYDAATRLLRALAAGEAGLSLAADGAAPPASAGGPEVTAPERTFSATTLADY